MSLRDNNLTIEAVEFLYWLSDIFKVNLPEIHVDINIGVHTREIVAYFTISCTRNTRYVIASLQCNLYISMIVYIITLTLKEQSIIIKANESIFKSIPYFSWSPWLPIFVETL